MDNALGHDTAQEILRYMQDNPGEGHPALVLADYLEDNGMPGHAEMIRLHHRDPQKGLYEREAGGDRWNFPVTENHSEIVAHPSMGIPNKWYLSLTVNTPDDGANARGFRTYLPEESAKHLANALVEEGASYGHKHPLE